MEPKGSLPYSQVPATCPYPQPAWSSPYPISHFLKIHLHIILPSAPGFPHWSFFPTFPHQNLVHASPIPHMRSMPCPSNSSQFYHLHNIGWGVQKSSSLCSFLHSPSTSSLLGLNILLNTLFSNTLRLRSSLNISDQVSHPYKTTGRIIGCIS